MTEQEKKSLYESIMQDVAKIVKQRIEEMNVESDISEELNENVDAATEKKNEQFVSNLCRKYKLVYNEGDSVCGTKEQLSVLKKVRELVSKRMPVHSIRWVGTPENQYYFCFESWRSKLL